MHKALEAVIFDLLMLHHFQFHMQRLWPKSVGVKIYFLNLLISFVFKVLLRLWRRVRRGRASFQLFQLQLFVTWKISKRLQPIQRFWLLWRFRIRRWWLLWPESGQVENLRINLNAVGRFQSGLTLSRISILTVIVNIILNIFKYQLGSK